MPVARPTLPLAWTWTLRAFVGTDAGALDVTGDADADMPALRPKARLLFSKKILIADHLQRLVEDRLVIAAVVRERREVLIDDLVVVGKGIRRNEIAPADFGAVDLEFVRGDVEQPFDDEHAVLPPGAAIRRDDRFIGEDRGKGAVVVWDDVGAQQRALRIDRHRQSVGIVGAGIVEEHVLDAEDAAVGSERNFGIVRLPALLGRGEEVFEPVLDPFDRTIEFPRRPRDHDLFGIEQHDLRPEAAANKWSDHPYLPLAQTEHAC